MITFNMQKRIARDFGFPPPGDRWNVREVDRRDAPLESFVEIYCICPSPVPLKYEPEKMFDRSGQPHIVTTVERTYGEPAPGPSRPGKPPRLRFYRVRIGRCDRCGTVHIITTPPASQP